MTKILFLCSGGGGNFKFIRECINAGIVKDCSLEIIADRECDAYSYAKNNYIPAQIISYSRTGNSDLFEALQTANADVIITNIHKVLDAQIVGTYKNKLINLHYSLLPLYKGGIGTGPVKQALEDGCRFVGTTVHYVNEIVDAGEIIAQSVIRVNEKLGFDNLMNLVFRSGCTNLLNALSIVTDINITSDDSSKVLENMFFSPDLSFNHDFSAVWDRIK